VFRAGGAVVRDEELSHAKATGCRRSGRSGGGGVSSSAIGGTTRSPSSEVGENDRFCSCKMTSISPFHCCTDYKNKKSAYPWRR